MDSFTITFSGKSSVLESVFFPPIDLSTQGEYQIGLVDFQSYNSIYNVNEPDNVLYYHEPKMIPIPRGNINLTGLSTQLTRLSTKNIRVSVATGKLHVDSSADIHVILKKGLLQKLIDKNLKSDSDVFLVDDDVWYCDLTANETKKITIPEGNYEISEIEEEVQKTIPDFKLTGNNILMKCILKSSKVFNFTKGGMGQSMLGFRKYSTPDIENLAFNKVNINNVNVIRIKCNIAAGSYINGQPDHTIHSFFPLVPPGFKLVEVPKNIIYFPINVRTLDVVTVSIVDQNDKVLNFHDEEITLRCHITRIQN